MKIEKIGSTYENRDIYAYFVGNQWFDSKSQVEYIYISIGGVNDYSLLTP